MVERGIPWIPKREDVLKSWSQKLKILRASFSQNVKVRKNLIGKRTDFRYLMTKLKPKKRLVLAVALQQSNNGRADYRFVISKARNIRKNRLIPTFVLKWQNENRTPGVYRSFCDQAVNAIMSGELAN